MAAPSLFTLPLAGVLVGAWIVGVGHGGDAPGAAALEARAMRVAAPASADTVVRIRAGDRVAVELPEGRVVLEGIEGDGLEVDDGRRGGVATVRRRGSTLWVGPERRDEAEEGILRLRVPRGVEVEVTGGDLDVVASGLEGGLRVQVVEGELRARNLRGLVELRTVHGDVEVDGVDGDVVAVTVDGNVRVASVRGGVVAETMDGDVTVVEVDGGAVDASTVDGDVVYRGGLGAGSRVRLVTHDGDVTAELPSDASAEVEVATWDGEFIPDFPVRVGRVEAGQPLRFTMGSGAARLEIQVFDGDIQLRHGPGR